MELICHYATIKRDFGYSDNCNNRYNCSLKECNATKWDEHYNCDLSFRLDLY